MESQGRLLFAPEVSDHQVRIVPTSNLISPLLSVSWQTRFAALKFYPARVEVFKIPPELKSRINDGQENEELEAERSEKVWDIPLFPWKGCLYFSLETDIFTSSFKRDELVKDFEHCFERIVEEPNPFE